MVRNSKTGYQKHQKSNRRRPPKRFTQRSENAATKPDWSECGASSIKAIYTGSPIKSAKSGSFSISFSWWMEATRTCTYTIIQNAQNQRALSIFPVHIYIRYDWRNKHWPLMMVMIVLCLCRCMTVCGNVRTVYNLWNGRFRVLRLLLT